MSEQEDENTTVNEEQTESTADSTSENVESTATEESGVTVKVEDNSETVTITKESEDGKKFKRSKDRCHLINRTAIYDKNGDKIMYNFCYTAGPVFDPKAIQLKHVMHIIVGYYVRRNMDLFVEEQGSAMLSLPVSNDFLKFARVMPMQRFVLHLALRQEAPPTAIHVINQLHRMHMRIAANVYTIVYTRWSQALRSFDYAVIDMTQDIDEQVKLMENIKQQAPWIKVICENAFDKATAAQSLSMANVDYICAPQYPDAIIEKRYNSTFPYKYPNLFADTVDVFSELMATRTDYQAFIELMQHYPLVSRYISDLVEFLMKGNDADFKFTGLDTALLDLDVDTLDIMMSLLCIRLLATQFESDENRNRGDITYEPFKTALIRAEFIKLILKKDEKAEFIPAFTTGLVSIIDEFYGFHTPQGDEKLTQLKDQLTVECDIHKDLGTALKVIKAMEMMDVDAVPKIVEEDGFFNMHDIVSCYESAVIWTVNVIKTLGVKLTP